MLKPVPGVECKTLIQINITGAHDAAVARNVHAARRQAIDAEDVAAPGYGLADCIPFGPLILKLSPPWRPCMFKLEVTH